MQRTDAVTRTIAVITVAAFFSSWMATGLARAYAIRRSIVDIPNHRSSHTVPTPRGGGLGIVIAFLAGAFLLALTGVVRSPTATAIALGAFAIALVGWIDDRRGVSARWRFMVQLLAAGSTIWSLGGFPALAIGRHTVELGGFGLPIAIIGVVWFTNLFNFMDGIDGIAGGQALTAGGFGAAMLWCAGQTDLAGLALIVAAASFGFLLWNWSPAKIFMGDVGSSTLGFILAAIAVAAANAHAVSIPVSSALMAPFIVDATLTLFRRVGHGEKWYEPHRSHAYQRAVQSGLTHRQVASAVGLASAAAGCGLLATRTEASDQLGVVVAAWALSAAMYLSIEWRRPMRSRAPRVKKARLGDNSAR